MKTILQYFCSLLLALVTISACQTRQPQQGYQEQTKPATTTQPTTPSTTSSTPTNPRTDSLVQVFNEGKKLFANCAICHNTNKEKLIGPGLQGVLERREVDWVIAFIKNSQQLIASGDSIAVALYNEYDKTQMQSFSYTPKEMQNLLFYLANLGRKQNEYITLDELSKLKKK